MGSWNATCALSNLPILSGDPCVFLILTRNPYNDGSEQGNYHNAFWFVRSVPLFGTYDDYGGMTWDEEEKPLTKSIENQFKLDFLLQSPQNPNEVVPEFEFSDFLNWFAGGRVSAKDPNVEQFKEHFLPLYNKVVETFGAALEGGDVFGLPADVCERNRTRKHAHNYLKRDLALPCTFVLIHKGVWDSLCEFRYEDSDGKSLTGLKELRVEAQDFLNSLKNEIPSFSSRRIHYKSPSDYFRLIVNGVPGSRHNSFARLFSTSSDNTPPFQNGPETAFELLLCENDFNVEDPSVLLLADRMCQLLVIEHFLSKTRRAWFPTTGAGSQSERYIEHIEYYIRCAKQAKIAYEESVSQLDPEFYSKSELKKFAAAEKRLEKLIESLSTPTSTKKSKAKPKKVKS